MFKLKIKLFLTTLILSSTALLTSNISLSPAAAAENYTVISGDCLWSIANKFGTTVYTLKAENNLTTDLITPGQVITVSNNTAQPVSRGTVDRSLPAEKNITQGKLLAWENVHPWFKKGTTAILKDIDTGKQFAIYRLFGTNHADCEPLTAQDSKIMNEIYEGKWSWTRRAVILIYNGQAVAASMAGMPHGSCNIKENNFNGHFDLHFLNSRTHGTNKVDPDHQRMVHKAASKIS